MCWLLSSEEIWSTSDFSFSQVTSVEKREPRKHFSASACSFLGLGLRPRPQKSGFGFEKLFLGSLFSTSVTWEKLKSDVDKFFLRVASTIFKTKYYFCYIYHDLQNAFCQQGLFFLETKNNCTLMTIFDHFYWISNCLNLRYIFRYLYMVLNALAKVVYNMWYQNR